ncbi:MAG: hypothetical protein V4653_08000 [Pseudomonadota bacterium]
MPRSDAALAVADMAEGARMMLGVTAALVGSGRRVDLAGLDDEFGRLCAGILALPLAESRRLRPKLEALREQLDHLHTALPPP